MRKLLICILVCFPALAMSVDTTRENIANPDDDGGTIFLSVVSGWHESPADATTEANDLIQSEIDDAENDIVAMGGIVLVVVNYAIVLDEAGDEDEKYYQASTSADVEWIKGDDEQPEKVFWTKKRDVEIHEIRSQIQSALVKKLGNTKQCTETTFGGGPTTYMCFWGFSGIVDLEILSANGEVDIAKYKPIPDSAVSDEERYLNCASIVGNEDFTMVIKTRAGVKSTLTKGVKFKTDVKAGIKFKLVTAGVTMTQEISLSEKKEMDYTKEVSFTRKIRRAIPARKLYTVTATITRSSGSWPFKAEVLVDGWFTSYTAACRGNGTGCGPARPFPRKRISNFLTQAERTFEATGSINNAEASSISLTYNDRDVTVEECPRPN